MLSRFYQRFSVHILWLAVVTFPYMYYVATTLPANNDIETWLPKDSAVRATYNEFKRHFGAEELILVGLELNSTNPELIEAVCERIEELAGIRQCWSPARMRVVMGELGVSEEEVDRRLHGLSVSTDGKLIGLVALLSPEGLQDRAATVDHVKAQLAYCQLNGDRSSLAGAPVVIAELDRLGGKESNQKFFLITLLLCLGLLYYSIREWRLAFSILGLTMWAINTTLAGIHMAGGEMNFVLDALPVMVMVFTLAIAIHFLNYYRESSDDPDPLGAALRLAWKPCCLATLTTGIGLISLTISEIGPVCQFGYAAAFGSFIALVAGLGLTPALLTLWPPTSVQTPLLSKLFSTVGNRLLDRSRTVALTTSCLVGATCIGLLSLESKIDPLDFLPKDGKVLSDVVRIQKELTNTQSIEAVVNFGDEKIPFMEKLTRVRDIESQIREHPAVQHTMSLASFFPTRFPESALETSRLLSRAQGQHGDNDYIAEGDRLWRISARISPEAGITEQQAFDELVEMTAGLPIVFTGIAPLLETAQKEIFRGFWESFTTAFAIITLVMIVSLRSLKAGLVAMIPNLTPICIVFGTLGWIGFPVDIGMMMSGSIALGIAVDGTFHYLVRYQEHMSETRDSQQSARFALLHTGLPILQATIVTSIGMLALTLSSFGPTSRFGFLMATMLVAALLGDLVLLPSLLYLRRSTNKEDSTPLRRHQVARPHHLQRRRSAVVRSNADWR